MNGIKHVGFVWSLYVKSQFIEYFVTPESAKQFAKKYYDTLEYFVKPVAYYDYKENSQ